MVARTPPTKQRKMVAPPPPTTILMNPLLIRETLKKVDQCTARLQELQYIVTGGNKVISGKSLSPRSTRGETVGEILQATQFARDLVSVFPIPNNTHHHDPKTPITLKRRNDKQITPQIDKTTSQIQAKRYKEKQKLRSQSSISPSLRKARSRIHFKLSPTKKEVVEKENLNPPRYLANRVSPKHKPWVKKTIIFPNPLFLSTTPTKQQQQQQQQKFCKTRSPVIARSKQQTPHKFLIKSPVKIKSPALGSTSSARPANLSKKSPPKLSAGARMRRSFSPSRLANKLAAASPAKLRRSFSPSGLVKRLPSPLKRRNSIVGQTSDELISGLRQRPFAIPLQFSNGRI
ncbi:hypothetical protein ACFE04_007475 [Oxalis oulophora]